MATIRQDDLATYMADAGVDQWGVAACPPSPWPLAPALPFAISLGIRIRPSIIAEVVTGPTPAYFAEYQHLNAMLTEVAEGLATLLRDHGAVAEAGRDVTWTAGMARAELLDVFACERQCDSYADTVGGDVCGICIAVCPFGQTQDDGAPQTTAR